MSRNIIFVFMYHHHKVLELNIILVSIVRVTGYGLDNCGLIPGPEAILLFAATSILIPGSI
jgi:hypothetical protein